MVPHESPYTRGCNPLWLHPYLKNNFWSIGYLNSIQIIHSKDTKKQILEEFSEYPNKNMFIGIITLAYLNRNLYNCNFKNIIDAIQCLDFKNKLLLLCVYIFTLFPDKIFNYLNTKFHYIYIKYNHYKNKLSVKNIKIFS